MIRYIAIMVLLLVVVYFVLRKPKVSRSRLPVFPSNIIPMDKHRKTKKKNGEQPCSSCKKKNGKLIFYAQENGTIVGLCKDCRVKAKKQDMLPL